MMRGISAAPVLACLAAAVPASERYGPDGAVHAASRQPLHAAGQRVVIATYGSSRDGDIGRVHLSQLALGYYVADGLAAQVGVNLAYADPDEQPNGVQGGPEVGMRWHFLTRRDWSAYLDGSAAAVWHEHPLTANSLRFNFDLQGGVGATRSLTDDTSLMGGLRWHHLSNARVRGRSRNLGYDAPLLYGGLMHRF